MEPDALYVGCVCTYGGVYENVKTFPPLPESMLEPVDFYYEDDEELEAVSVQRRLPVAAVNHRLRWTQDEIDFLREAMFSMPIAEVARFLGRTENACREMLFYGSEEGKESRELARHYNEKIEATQRGRFWGSTSEEMGF